MARGADAGAAAGSLVAEPDRRNVRAGEDRESGGGSGISHANAAGDRDAGSADTDGTLADLVHQTAMYYEDRLNGAGFARVILVGAASAGLEHAGEFDQMRLSLERRLTTPVETIDPRMAAALTDRITAGPELLDVLAPLVGLLLRDRESAA